MATATLNEHNTKTSIGTINQLPEPKGSECIDNSAMAQDTNPFHETWSIEQESEQLEAAICNAVTSLHEDNELYIYDEEKEKKRKENIHQSTPATKYLNIQCPTRPNTYMIVEKIQGQRTRLPLRVLMDPGSDHSYIHVVYSRESTPKRSHTQNSKVWTSQNIEWKHRIQSYG
jgi:hypothetical protein